MVAVLVLAAVAGARDKAGAAPISAPMGSHSAASGSALLHPGALGLLGGSGFWHGPPMPLG